jgi:hypothetical protein
MPNEKKRSWFRNRSRLRNDFSSGKLEPKKMASAPAPSDLQRLQSIVNGSGVEDSFFATIPLNFDCI